VVGSINNNCCTYDFAFQVAGSAVGIIEGNAGHMMRPFGEFCGDGADAVVVVNTAGMIDGYVMAANATYTDSGNMSRATVALCTSSCTGSSLE
jgi:hypothetical protein